MSRVSATIDLERELWQRKGHGDQDARTQLILVHDCLAKKLARKYAGSREPLEDLIQVARIGLINAVDRFDPDRGIRFSTFATPTILGELRRFFRGKGGGVKVSRRLSELGQDIATAEDKLTQRFQRSPTVSEIAEHLNVHPNEVLEAILARDTSWTESLERSFKDEDFSLEELIGLPDPEIQEIEGTGLVGRVLDAIAKLDKRSRQVIRLRYVEGKSQTEVARLMNYSQMHVSRLLKGAIVRIRELVQKGG